MNGLQTPSEAPTKKHTHAHEVHAPDIIPSHCRQQKNVHTMLCTVIMHIIQSQFYHQITCILSLYFCRYSSFLLSCKI